MTKTELRRAARARLAAIGEGERRTARAAVAARLWTLPAMEGAGTLLCFAGLPDEIPTDQVAEEALRRGARLVYPRVRSAGEVTLHRVDGPDALRPGRWGIREPDPGHSLEVGVEAIDAVLVPGLAWDRGGRRLGRGGGFYDRLFADPGWRGFRCGVFWALQEVERVPVDPWDVPLDAVVTEREAWRPPCSGVPPTASPSARSRPLPPPRSGSR
ncbi:MAG: 5-formyltetrahydrofolate cyclo-ligase [Gemmatimonadota bacterium]|nr:5-formyltetrahydrofolate cyclo-ligase [Gemmatimonadota bacterium]